MAAAVLWLLWLSTPAAAVLLLYSSCYGLLLWATAVAAAATVTVAATVAVAFIVKGS